MNPLPDTKNFLSGPAAEYQTSLLAWFDRNRRALPWRQRRSLYGTWISEVMLQQTTVATVVPFWEKFIAAFPDVVSLANADLAEVLKMWAGLGYYRRARHLHQAARIIVSQENGKLPDDLEGWLRLPGIGPYTGGAIASIGLQKRVPAVDANVRRVLTRWLVADPRDLASLRPANLATTAEKLVAPDRPGQWNEGLMELGALICRAADPVCGKCPVQDLCRAHQGGRPDLIPAPKVAATVRAVRLGVLVLAWGDRVMLVSPGGGPAVIPQDSPVPVRKDVSGLHQGLWGLPSTPWLPEPSPRSQVWSGRIWRPLVRSVSNSRLGGDQADPRLLGKFRHAITRYRLVVQVYGQRLAVGPPVKSMEPGQEKIFQPSDEISQYQAEGDDRPLTARFCPWPDLDRPVSNLVKKSLLIAESTLV